MRYVIMIMNTEASKNIPEAEADQWSKEIFAWYEKWGAAGKLVDGGAELDSPEKAKTIRASGITDGPFIEAKEVVGGFSILETTSVDEAVEIAKTWPGVDRGLITIEVRPVYVR